MDMQIDVQRKSFRAESESSIVLESIRFAVKQGTITGMFGPSGCGKSTLLRIMAGLDTNFRGTIQLGSQLITKPDRRIGFVAQYPVAFEWLTVADNIRFGLKYAQRYPAGNSVSGWDREVRGLDSLAKVQLVASMVGLSTGDLEKRPGEISGGMRQRMAFGRALMAGPTVLLLDEPFSALDYQSREALQNVVIQVRDKWEMSFVCVSHDPEEIIYLVDQVIVLRDNPTTIVEMFRPKIPYYGSDDARYTPEFQSCKRELRKWLS